MGLNTYPYNPFPASTDKLDEAHNEQIQEEVDQLKSGLTTLDNEVNGDATVYPYADVITIPDAVPSNLADCKVKIDPVQDLHGYDNPWVGGAGKNIIPMTVASIKAVNSGVVWTDNACVKNDVTWTILTDDANNVIGIKANGTADGNSQLSLGTFDISANTYTLRGCPVSENACGITVGYIGTDGGSGKTTTIENSVSTNAYCTINAGKNVSNVIFYPQLEVGNQATTFAPYTNICPITGHTEASVEVTDGDDTTKTYTIALGDTIYGGTVDFDSGVMTVDRVCVDADTLEWQKHSTISNNVYITDESATIKPSPNDTASAKDICSDYETKAWDALFLNYAVGFGVSRTGRFAIANPSITTLSDFETSIADTQICYELATPTTIQLTPKQIQLLKGQNTITASTGQISVTVNGVSGSIGAVQEQANATDAALAELAADIAEQLPTAPTTDGAYILTVTVASGTPTYSWESAE